MKITSTEYSRSENRDLTNDIKNLEKAGSAILSAWKDAVEKNKKLGWSESFTTQVTGLLKDMQEARQAMQNGVKLFENLEPEKLLSKADDLLRMLDSEKK